MEWAPVLISLKTACMAMFFTFFLGLAAAKWVVSIRRGWIKAIIDGIFTLPLVLPPTVAGFFLLYIFGIYRPLGRLLLDFFGVKVVFSWGATVIAAVLISFPLMYRAALGAFEQADPSQADAARMLGVSEWKIFTKITVPNASSGILSGAVLAFARGIGEFGATAMIAGNIAGKTRTLPLAIYSEVAAGNMDKAGVYVAILLVISFAAIVLMNLSGRGKLSRRKRGK
ncbi:MAG: molybdate ABC transporter permease subunit [Lachnospiraceae bacterium]|nr:molybdate ABC transporter permease subunit [Lachnospiraceae bacterium]